MLDGDEVQPADGRNWRNRLSQSREVGTGFAAPGGSFTRALYEWSFTPKGQIMHSLLKDRRVVELGAGMLSYGYALANHCGAKNFVAVEPFYADVQKASIQTYLSGNPGMNDRIPHKVIDLDMLAYLQAEPDNLSASLPAELRTVFYLASTIEKKWKVKLYAPWKRIPSF